MHGADARSRLTELLMLSWRPRHVIAGEFADLPGADQVLVFGSWAASYHRSSAWASPPESLSCISIYRCISTVLILGLMLIEVVRWLRESGLDVEQQTMRATADQRADAVLTVTSGGHSARFAVQTKNRAPYPNELTGLSRLRESASSLGVPLLTAPFIPESAGRALTAHGWSWADEHGDFDLRAPGLLFRQRRTMTVPRPVRKTLPGGAGSFAIIRSLISLGEDDQEEATATTLARLAGVSQPRASQVLARLLSLDLAEKTSDGWWRPRRPELLDRFLAEYPGPGGSEHYFYGLDPPAEIAVRAATALKDRVVVSADVGPDLITAWRRPSKVILYVAELADPRSLGLVEAQGGHDANAIVSMPADRSVFPARALTAELHGAEIWLADPVQMIWDLQRLGGSDRSETAGELRTWLLTRR
jgi:hypothetical protein